MSFLGTICCQGQVDLFYPLVLANSAQPAAVVRTPERPESRAYGRALELLVTRVCAGGPGKPLSTFHSVGFQTSPVLASAAAGADSLWSSLSPSLPPLPGCRE